MFVSILAVFLVCGQGAEVFDRFRSSLEGRISSLVDWEIWQILWVKLQLLWWFWSIGVWGNSWLEIEWIIISVFFFGNVFLVGLGEWRLVLRCGAADGLWFLDEHSHFRIIFLTTALNWLFVDLVQLDGLDLVVQLLSLQVTLLLRSEVELLRQILLFLVTGEINRTCITPPGKLLALHVGADLHGL